MAQSYRTSAETGVEAAFDLLVDEIARELRRTNERGSAFFGNGDYDGVESAARRAKRIGEFQKRVEGLKAAWATIDDDEDITSTSRKRNSRASRRATRARRQVIPAGKSTPRSEFYVPILQTLVEFGGTALTSDVVERVGNLMADRLLPLDWEGIPSDRNRPRWKGTLSNARQILRRNRWISLDSPMGVWEITDEGRQWLAEQQQSSS